MIKIIVIITILLLSIGVGIQLRYDPGYVLIAINHWTIETTLSIFILSLILLLILVYIAHTLLRWFIHIPTSFHEYTIKHAAQKAHKKTQQSIYYEDLLNLIKQNQAQALSYFIKRLPNKLRYDASIITSLGQYLLEHNQDEQAEGILRHCLKKQYNEEVMKLYSLIKQDKANVGFVESLLKKNPNSPALYLCLGRINQSKQLWGKARIYFEKSIALAPNAYAYLQLGLLLEALNQHSDAYAAYKTGLCLSDQKK